MAIGFTIIVIYLSLVFIPPALCLLLIKKRNYSKLPSKKNYAGFWYRVLAYIVDFIILSIVGWIITIVTIIAFPLGIILNILLSWLYFVVLQSSKSQATFGMRVCGIKIYDEQLKRASFWRLTGRLYSCTLSALILFIGFFMIGFTERKQGLHDIVARTIHLKD